MEGSSFRTNKVMALNTNAFNKTEGDTHRDREPSILLYNVFTYIYISEYYILNQSQIDKKTK